MAQRHEILLDADAGIGWKHVNLKPDNALQQSPPESWSINSISLTGGVSEGVECVELCTGRAAWSILPTRGMGLWKGQLGTVPIGWKSPVKRPVHPAHVNLTERNGLGWLNGFNELLCRCGLAYQGPPGNDNGEQLTLHGRIANIPAIKVEAVIPSAGTGTMELHGVVEELTFFGPCYRLETTYRTKIGSHRLSITDVITNLGARPAPLMLLYHLNLGEPFLGEGATVTVPSRDVVPRDARSGALGKNWNRYAAPQPGFAEEGFFFNPLANADGWCTAVLANRTADKGFAIRFRTETLPWFTVWKNTMALEEGYVTGIEPGVNLPNVRGYERDHGRLPMIPPGDSYRCELELVAEDSSAGVAQLREEAARCQGSTPQKFHPQPQPGWSPAGDAAK
jgi:galactose mutarotase-like enzyme